MTLVFVVEFGILKLKAITFMELVFWELDIPFNKTTYSVFKPSFIFFERRRLVGGGTEQFSR